MFANPVLKSLDEWMSELTVTLIGVSDASLSLAQLLDASSPTIENRKDQNYQVSATSLGAYIRKIRNREA